MPNSLNADLTGTSEETKQPFHLGSSLAETVQTQRPPAPTEAKRPCADCTNVEPCDILERCIKHDPVPKLHDEYKQLTIPDGTHIETCPVCAADPELWQYVPKPDDPAQKVVCCAHSEDIGPHDSLAGGGCPLYMPPLSFYRPTIREAVKHWNEYALALRDLRRSNANARGASAHIQKRDKPSDELREQRFDAAMRAVGAAGPMGDPEILASPQFAPNHELCGSCGGTGRIPPGRPFPPGECLTCHGKGVTFKSTPPPEHRL